MTVVSSLFLMCKLKSRHFWSSLWALCYFLLHFSRWTPIMPQHKHPQECDAQSDPWTVVSPWAPWLHVQPHIVHLYLNTFKPHHSACFYLNSFFPQHHLWNVSSLIEINRHNFFTNPFIFQNQNIFSVSNISYIFYYLWLPKHHYFLFK